LKKDLKEVDGFLFSILGNSSSDVEEACRPVVEAGGKRLRPLLVLTSGLTGDYNREVLVPAAACVELLHLSSLIHDDLLDEAMLRRGVPTINSKYGRKMATAIGDYLFATTFKILSSLNNSEVISVMARAAHALSIGELQQMRSLKLVKTNESEYFERIRNKTAFLFSAACQVGSLLSSAPSEVVNLAGEYGEYLGLAFQILDDVLDVVGSEEVLGKPAGLDLKEGIITLPIIYALEESGFDERIVKVIGDEEVKESTFKEAMELIRKTRAVERAREVAAQHISLALKKAGKISSLEARESFIFIGQFVMERYY
jgi:heptaprenyl diphosphate synthase